VTDGQAHCAIGSSGPIAALDPGHSKCGLVLSDRERGQVLEARVLEAEAVLPQLERWHSLEPLAGVVLGNGTSSALWQRRLRGLWPVLLVEEAGTTLGARHRYWQLFPPGILQRLLPEGLRLPPRDWDDVVAQILLERHLGRPMHRLRAEPSP